VKFKKHADEVLPAKMTEKQVEEMVLTPSKRETSQQTSVVE